MSANNQENIFALKVDVDTLQGYLEGVPPMLEVLAKYHVKASFFFSFGPDNSGKAIMRIFRKGFLAKMLRTKAPSTYGLKTMMYGTLLPAPLIAEKNPQIIMDTFREGHECGIHAWDHVKWQDRLQQLSREEIGKDLTKAKDLCKNILGVQSRSFAAPGWQITPTALSVLDSCDFDYMSNTRGTLPFFPRIKQQPFQTLEIPSTLPTMDEIFGANGINDSTIVPYYLSLLKEGINVHTVHAEMEGKSKINQFEALIHGVLDKGYRMIPLCDVARSVKNASPGEIISGFLPGRAGTLALQQETISPRPSRER